MNKDSSYESFPLVEAGVSRELARQRKEQIGDLSYDLSFSIPEGLYDPIMGRIAIRFSLSEQQQVVLDYLAAESNIFRVEVNGVVADYIYHNEHIIIDAASTLAGENEVVIEFQADEQSLNRSMYRLYTLLVPDRARTLFPCFDQPDMKAEFTLHLTIPRSWTAVSNTALCDAKLVGDEYVELSFSATEPLSTYLFSFVAGKFEIESYNDGERTIHAYYVDSGADRTEQLEVIFEHITYSLDWLEEYTAIEYPFAKYDIVIIPDFQYGGMEHTGATLYNEERMFLDDNATPKMLMERANIIAHETAHMWFGDYVTMEWFDDVWIKEVFAGYYASCIVDELFTGTEKPLTSLSTTYFSSLLEDRTDGTAPIKQELDNLNNAGLIYSYIIYNKAPIMMQKLVEFMGEEAFQEGIREYLRTYAYGNATWEQLVAILDRHTEKDVTAFSDVWVHQKGMPHISLTIDDDMLHVSQGDKWQRDFIWPQSFEVMVVGEHDYTIEVDITQSCQSIPVPEGCTYILPNVDGRGYGHFITSKENISWMMDTLCHIEDDVARCAVLSVLNENYENGLITYDEWLKCLADAICIEQNVIISYLMSSYLTEVMYPGSSEHVEEQLWRAFEEHQSVASRKYIFNLLMEKAYSAEVCSKLYEVWEAADNPLLGDSDYISLSLELALRFPERSHYIVDTQKERLWGASLESYCYKSRAVIPGEEDTVFESLKDVQNRRLEPLVLTTLYLLNHPLRADEAVKYIRPGLDLLCEIQRTGDIFFPMGWLRALLANHRSDEARLAVADFIDDNPNYLPLLRNKILQVMWRMQREESL